MACQEHYLKNRFGLKCWFVEVKNCSLLNEWITCFPFEWVNAVIFPRHLKWLQSYVFSIRVRDVGITRTYIDDILLRYGSSQQIRATEHLYICRLSEIVESCCDMVNIILVKQLIWSSPRLIHTVFFLKWVVSFLTLPVCLFRSISESFPIEVNPITSTMFTCGTPSVRCVPNSG